MKEARPMKFKFVFKISLFCIFLIFSCSENKEENRGDTIAASDEPIEPKVKESIHVNQDPLDKVIAKARLNFEKVANKFKFSNIKQIEWIDNQKEFSALNQEEYYEAFQNLNYSEYEPAFYYSKQSEWHSLRRYIFVKEEESCCLNYYYNTYDSTGKIITSFIMGATGGDAGWVISSDGVIENDSTIRETVVECDFAIEANGKEVGDCDSTIYVYHLFQDGKFNRVKESSHKIKK